MLFIDNRIGSKDLATPLAQFGLPVETLRMESADIAFMGRGADGRQIMVGIELKKLPDLVSSFRTGRLSGHQLPGLIASFDFSYLLVEGLWKPDAKGRILIPRRGLWSALPGMPVSEMEKRLTTLDLLGGLRIKHSSSRACTLHFIANLYRWWNDGGIDRHTSHLDPHRPQSFLPISDFRKTIMTLPGIGQKTSLLVEKHFNGKLHHAFTATADTWAEIEGVGVKTSRAVVEYIHGR